MGNETAPPGRGEARQILLRMAGNDYPDGERWPLIRLGRRQPIPRYVRRGVYERDGGRCLSCGLSLTMAEAQLDHIIPWSAGGSDSSVNLRILCEPCNYDRSNFRSWLDVWGAQRPPIAFYCSDCLHRDRYGEETCEPFPVTPEMVSAYCVQCGLVSRTWPQEVY